MAGRWTWPPGHRPDRNNPRVGCVLTAPDGSSAAATPARPAARMPSGRAARGTPPTTICARHRPCHARACSHHGRTPPCADALVEAGLAQVVIAALDQSLVAQPWRAGCAQPASGGPRPDGRGLARAQHRLLLAHAPRPALGAHEGCRRSGWPQRLARRTQPVDHRRPRVPTAMPGGGAQARS